MNVPAIDAAVWSWWEGIPSEGLTPVVIFFTTLTRPLVLTIGSVLVAAFLIYRRRLRVPELSAVLAVPAVVVLANLTSHLIKPLLARPRPPEELSLVVESTWAMPSGHATVAAALATALTLAFRGTGAGLRFLVPIWATAVAVCLSRLYLGVHWFTDIVAGVGLGIGVALGGWWALHRLWA